MTFLRNPLLLILLAVGAGAEPAAPFAARLGFRVAAGAGDGEPLRLLAGTKETGFALAVAANSLTLQTPQGKNGIWRGTLAAGEHELILRIRPDSASVILDGERRLRLPAAPPPGQIRAVAQAGTGIEPTGRPLVQRLGDIRFADDFARDPEAEPLWTALAGRFAPNASHTPGASQGAFEFWAVAPGARGIALANASHWFWDDCEVGVSGRGSADSAWGLVVCFRDADNWRAVVVDPSTETVRVIARTDGREEVLRRETLPLRAGQWYRLTVAMHDGRGAIFLNGHRIPAGEDAGWTGGRIGLLVETNPDGELGATFDDVEARSLTTPVQAWSPALPFGPSETHWADFSQKDFAADPFMTQWAHPRAFWDEEADGLAWFRTRLFHDVRVHWRRTDRQRAVLPLRVALFAEPDRPGSGYRLEVDAKAVSVSREGETVATAPHGIEQVTSLEFAAEEGSLRVALNGTEVAAWRDPAPLTSGRVGASLGRTSGLNVRRADWRDTTRVESSHRIDYGFDCAPVAWESPDAAWRATHRWACVPKWSFFGGRGEPAGNGAENANATLWNLRRFGGDLDIELFVAPMEGTPQRVHFASPTNLNVVFAASDGNYDSGYLLAFGLYDAPTRLFRAGRELAVWDGRVDAGLRRRPVPLYNRVTRVWQQIRIQRRGSRLVVDVAKHDDQAAFLGMERVFDLEDADPLPGDRIGLWSHGPNGLAVARATVSFAESPGAVPPRALPSPPSAANEPARIRTAMQRISGGAQPLWFGDLPEDLARTGLLECPIRIAPGQRTSLFVHLRGQVAEAVLTGPETHRESTVPLGRGLPESYLPGTWTSLRLDLGTALRRHFPEGPLVPDAIAIDSPCDSFAEIAGFGRNRIGGFVQVGEPVWAACSPETRPARELSLRVGRTEPLRPQWHTFGASDGASVHREDDGSIRLFNRRVAGPAGATLDWGPFPVAAFPRLVFEYRLPESVETNLLVDANGQRFEIRATGVDHTWPLLGSISGFRADGEWHRAEVDLRGLLATRFPAGARIVVEALRWADSERMSTPRVAYWFRNVALVPAVDPTCGLEIELRSDEPLRALAHLLDQQPSTAPPTEPTGPGGKLRIPGGDTARFLHVRAQFADGEWSAPLHLPLLEDAVPEWPATDRPTPVAAGPPPTPRVVCVPSDRLCFDDFEEEGAMGGFRIRRGAWVEPAETADGSRCVQITNLGPSYFFSGYFRAAPWNLDRWPRVAFDYRFEQPGCNLNLSLLVNEAMTIVEWTGRNAPGNYFHEAVVGALPEARQDGQWHRVEFDLREMVYAKRLRDASKRGRVIASELSCWATNRNGGGYANPNAARLLVDNFAIFSPSGNAPEFRWQVPGPAPQGYATLLDRKPDTVPPETVDTEASRRQCRDLAPGEWWFHVRARHHDGRWGPPGHARAVVAPQ